MNVIIEKLLSRNYHLAILAMTGAFIGMYMKVLTGAEYVTLCVSVVGMFRAGDAVVNWIHAGKDDPK